jgi:hypothetical protein
MLDREQGVNGGVGSRGHATHLFYDGFRECLTHDAKRRKSKVLSYILGTGGKVEKRAGQRW